MEQNNNNQQGQTTVDQIDSINPIALLKSPELYKESFQTVLKIAVKSFQTQSYERGIKAYTKCLDMLDLGKNIINENTVGPYMKICVYNNIAYAHLNTNKLMKCSKACQKAIEESQKVMISLNKQAFLKLSISLIILKFQHCAILSQLQQHQRALQLCKSNLIHITNYLETLYTFVTQSLKLHDHRRKSGQTVHFSRQVYKFAQNILRELMNYIQEPMLKKEEMVFYYWQKNPQKNEQQLRKKFIPVSNQNCKRSILGVSKISHWIDDFNIGTIMHMTILYSKQMQNIFPIDEYVFKDKLYEIAIYCSMCYFTMATQTRFIQSNAQSSQINNKQNNDKIMKKYGYVTKSDLFKQSQVYHLCSIDVMSRVIKSNIPYINHIIKSYEKHYIKEKKLDQISSIPQESIAQINETILQYKPNDRLDKSKVSFAQRHKNLAYSNLNANMQNQLNNNILTNQFKQQTFSSIMKTNPFQTQPVLYQQKKIQQELKSPLTSSNSESFKNQNHDEYLKSVNKKKSKSKLTKVKTQQKQKMKQQKQKQKKIKVLSSANYGTKQKKKPVVITNGGSKANMIDRQKSPSSNYAHKDLPKRK